MGALIGVLVSVGVTALLIYLGRNEEHQKRPTSGYEEQDKSKWGDWE